MAVTMSLVALSIDAMLPAFPHIADGLGVENVNDVQLIISVLLVGLAIGQLFYGPLSDAVGRKPAMAVGFAIFIVGCLLSVFSTSFFMMLVGRLLQGLGAAGPRTVSLALIRDRFRGSAMAQVMSLIMTVFIIVPIVAPALGQFILLLAGWRAIFGALMALALITLVWLGLRQPETLPKSRRIGFSFVKLRAAFRMVFSNRVSMVYTAISGMVAGGIFGYINVSQQVFQVQYDVGLKFPLYFGLIATSIGAASVFNGSLVMKVGMHWLAFAAMVALAAMSWILLATTWLNDGHPPFVWFLINFMAIFFCNGVLFGNINSIAMEPLGHVAGTGAAVIGSISTALAILIGLVIGYAYDGTLFPIALGFTVLSTTMVVLARSVDTPEHVR